LQLADQIYHYQHVDSGYIRLIKQDVASFHHSYRFLQNRPLHSSRIDVSDDTLTLLQDHFSQLYVNQELLFKALANVEKDRLFLQQLLQEQPSNTVLQIKGLGLFKANPQPIVNPTLQRLQALIKTSYGTDFLTERAQQLHNAITTLTPSDWSKPLATPVYTLAEHYQDVQTARHAIQLLQQNSVLTANTITLSEPLTRKDAQRLENFQLQLQNNILSLLNSNRPDWGYALLINIARLMAVDASLHLQQWVFIDDFADDSQRVPSEHIPDLPAQLQAAKQQWLATKPNTDFTEMAYSRLEMTANHYAELNKTGQGISVRYAGEQALPDKPVPLVIDSVPNLGVAELKQALADLSYYETQLHQQLAHHNRYDLVTRNCVTELKQALADLSYYETQLHQQLAHHNRYDLVTRNCVTELFRSLDDAIINSTTLRLAQSANTHLEQPLGGHIRADYNFIPWLAFQSVQSQLRVSDSQLFPSYRGLQLEKSANQPWQSLREISTLTSPSYSFNSDDAWFLFFTDDSVLLRPLLGAVNTATAITQTVLGLFTLPFDEGENLHAGAVGILMSTPELLFINIRKGSYPYLPPSLALLGIANEADSLSSPARKWNIHSR